MVSSLVCASNNIIAMQFSLKSFDQSLGILQRLHSMFITSVLIGYKVTHTKVWILIYLVIVFLPPPKCWKLISFDCQKSGILSKTGYLRAPYVL